MLAMLSPHDRLCFAILDYQSAPKGNGLCLYPVEFDIGSVRGEIRGAGSTSSHVLRIRRSRPASAAPEPRGTLAPWR
jgi:hypothetical protein